MERQTEGPGQKEKVEDVDDGFVDIGFSVGYSAWLIDQSIYFFEEASLMGETEGWCGASSSSSAVEAGKREKILRAAVKVFAQKGYFGSRVSDIAEEAGIAYGLVYHYFKNKEELLLALFQESWDLLLRRIREVKASSLGAREKLRQIAAFLLKGFRADPERMEVLVVEVIRSSKILKGQTLGMIQEAFHLLEEIVDEGKQEGVVREDLDSRIATSIFYGALDQIITDWVLGLYPRRPDEEDLALEMVDRVVLGGMAPFSLSPS